MQKPITDAPSPGAAFMTATTVDKLAKIYGGMPFLAALPESPAARAGLRWGDVVVAVNGLPTPGIEAFVEARATREGSAVIRFVRDGREREVELTW
jgi:S1-C subfamily serine protease